MQDTIEKAYWEGKRAWPALERATLEDFSSHVRRLGSSPVELEAHGTDIYLALACGMGDPEALRALGKVFIPQLDEHLARAGFDVTIRKDVFQQALLHLCTGATPRILTYAGRASLSAWLRVTAIRFALNMHPAADRNTQVALGADLEHVLASDCDPERRMAVEEVRPLFKAALVKAIGNLTDRDRTLLRLCYLDGLTVDAIGRMYQVHRASAARWIAAIRQKILADVQRLLATDPGFHASQFDSLAMLIGSDLHLSLSRLLGAA